MADFCLRCNLDHGFGAHSDFAHYGERGAITAADTLEGRAIFALCEGCGPTMVDHLGRCIGGCDAGHTPPEADEVLRSASAWQARRVGPLGRLYRLRDWWAGTPWDPGQIHHLRWRWHNWLDFWHGGGSDDL